MTAKKRQALGIGPRAIENKNTLQADCNPKKPDMSSKQSERIASYRAGIPPKYRKMYDRVMSGNGTPRQAIRLQCLACWGWSRSDAAECGGYDCSLFLYNPFQKPVKSPTEPLQQPRIDNRS